MKRLHAFLAIMLLWGFMVFVANIISPSSYDMGTKKLPVDSMEIEPSLYFAQSNILVPLAAVLFIILLLKIPRQETRIENSESVGIFRIFSAFYFDMWMLWSVYFVLSSFIFLVFESFHTGIFEWRFERDFHRSTDTPILMFFVWSMVYYYYKHLLLQKATIGQYVMGYEISNGGVPWTRVRSFGRIFYSVFFPAIIVLRYLHYPTWYKYFFEFFEDIAKCRRVRTKYL